MKLKDGNSEQLSLSDHYNAALKLHNQEFRTLGERISAFLIAQSILVAGFVMILTNKQLFPMAFDIIALGIILAGTLYGLLHHWAGKLGSEAALAWRKYMRELEGDQAKAPWNWLHGELRGGLQKGFFKRAPLPSNWLGAPMIFLGVWSFFYSYVVFNYIQVLFHPELAQYHQMHPVCFMIYSGVVLGFIVTAWVFLILGLIKWLTQR